MNEHAWITLFTLFVSIGMLAMVLSSGVAFGRAAVLFAQDRRWRLAFLSIAVGAIFIGVYGVMVNAIVKSLADRPTPATTSQPAEASP